MIRLKNFSQKVDECRARIASLKEKIGHKDEQRKAHLAQKGECQTRLRELGTKRKEILEERKAVQAQVKQILNAIDVKKADIEKHRAKLPFKNERSDDFVARNLQFIDKELSKVEEQMNSTSVSLSEEKKLLTDLGTWKSLKASLKDFDVQEEYQKVNELRDSVKSFNPRLDEITHKEDVILKQLENAHTSVLDTARSTQGLIKQMNAEFEKIEEHVQNRAKSEQHLRVLRQKRYDDNKAQRQAQEEERARKRLEYQEEKQRRHEEFLERQRSKEEARDAAELLQVPYQDELALCDNLTSYLEGVVAAAKKKPIKGDLKIQWEVFLSFEHVSLVPPKAFADVEKTLTDLKAKKEYYQKLSAEKVEQRKAEIAKAAEEREKARLEAEQAYPVGVTDEELQEGEEKEKEKEKEGEEETN
eukprot:TRINITY_DN4198_c0_g1_i4.p1 TRINITY_DN4198_c0_g1~~TRINITY_DN4198_c0_g1_i4.p1  ORF type:complete len:417 (-),score=174.61 TRINITY_DN4198_c0_g1_i4:56-1306(-)